jgi:putative transposase
VYNWALALRSKAYRQRGEHLFYRDTSAALTTLKQQQATSWLNEVSCVPPQQALRHLDKAFRNFFEGRAKYPTFKKKHGRQSAEYTTSAFTWDGKALLLAKMSEPLPIRWSRPMPKDAKPSTITLTRDQAGCYFVSFLIEEEITPLPVTPQIVGIDLGLEDVFTLSTGEKTGNEHFFRREEQRLARLQRRHAKKRKGSKNREKAITYSWLRVEISQLEIESMRSLPPTCAGPSRMQSSNLQVDGYLGSLLAPEGDGLTKLAS